MTPNIKYRHQQLRLLPTVTGVYALADYLAKIYAGQSGRSAQKEGIRPRSRRHLSGARSDINADRRIDPAQIVYVYAWPCDIADLDSVENAVIAQCGLENLLNFKPQPGPIYDLSKLECIRVQIVTDEYLQNELMNPLRRMTRERVHFAEAYRYYTEVKNNKEIKKVVDFLRSRLDLTLQECLRHQYIESYNNGIIVLERANHLVRI